MRSYIKTLGFSLVVSLATLPSCDNNLLETVPNDRLSENVFWQNEADAKLAVNALYNDLDGITIFSWDGITDIGHTNQSFAIEAYIGAGTYDATSSKIYTEWQNAYRGVRAANYFLANVDKVTFTNPKLADQYKGEARFLRAYQYVKLIGFFGEVPLITSPITIDESKKLTRTPVAELWTFINKELTEAAASLPVSYTAADKGRITQGAAWGLLSRAALLLNKYDTAAEASNKVIQSKNYSLYPSYEKLFSYAAENSSEVLLDKQFVKDIASHSVFQHIAPYSQKNGNSTFVPTKALVDSYETLDGKLISDPTSGYDSAKPYENRDPRLKFSVFLEGDILPSGSAYLPKPNSGTGDAIGNTYIATTTGFNIKKYINTEDFANPANSGINIILLRYAEILLNYAEAKIELNQVDDTVLDAINLVRNGRNDVKLPSVMTRDITKLREVVRNERKVEFAFEGLRLLDIRRWKIAENVIPKPVEGITYTNEKNELITILVPVNKVFDVNRHYLWPIPQKERDLNPLLTQNSGW